VADLDRPARTVLFLGDAQRWAQKVLERSEGRWRWGLPADVIVLASGEEIPKDAASLLLVVDARSTPPSEEIATAFGAGVDGYICNADSVLVLAHLDALARSLDRRT
jgi:hypothetical protein